MTEPSTEPSTWQRRIAGEWHGRPSLFDSSGNWCGFEDIRRSSTFDNGATVYRMDGGLTGGGPLAGQFKLAAPFEFGVTDSDADRIYTGPDFYGSGQPYGSFVDAHYYGPGWQVELNTWNQVLADGETQVYSSVLHQGWAVVGCFNGVYTRSDDPEAVQEFLATETRRGPVPYILPTKQAGAFRGQCELWGADQKPRGTTEVAIALEPVDLLHTRRTITLTDREFTTVTRRDGNRLFFEGPQAWGNAIGFGRASFGTWHLDGAVKVRSREFVLDAEPTMGSGQRLAVVYQIFAGNRLDSVLHGLLTWEAAT